MNFSIELLDLLLLVPFFGGTITGGSGGVAGTGTATLSDDLIIPEVWSSAIFGYFEQALILRGICDDYSSLVKGKGDTINIPEIPLATGLTTKTEGTSVVYGAEALVDTNLIINKHQYIAKMLEDFGQVQSNELLFNKYAKAMAYQLALAIDTSIMAELDDLGTTHTLGTGDNNITLADAETIVGTLLSNNLQLNECVWILNPPTYADLLAQGMLANVGTATVNSGINFDAPTAGGNVPQFFGMPVIQSSLIATTAGTSNEIGYCVKKGCVALAIQQDVRVQAEYSVDFLATKIVADVIYGCEKMTANKVMGVEILQN